MTTPKNKMDKEKEKDKEKKGTGRKDSLPEELGAKEPSTKDLMKEILKLQAVVTKMQENQDKQNNTFKEEWNEMKKDLKEDLQSAWKKDITEVRADMDSLKQDNKNLTKENKNLKDQQIDLKKKINTLEETVSTLKQKQENQEIQDKEYQLRIRNLEEVENENIREVITELISQIWKKTKEITEANIDRVFRAHSNYAKKYKAPRDVVVSFGRKNARDEILKENASSPTYYKGKRIVVMKEIPFSILERRRKYSFLTEELIRKNIRFKWDKKDGIVVTWNDTKYWLTSEPKARAFWEKMQKNENINNQGNSNTDSKTDTPQDDYSEEEGSDEETQPGQDIRRKGRKRPRKKSPKTQTPYSDSARVSSETEKETERTHDPEN
nr:M protein, serotype 6-like [Anolis sagrei ordinatus]